MADVKSKNRADWANGMKRLVTHAPWVLRVTEMKGKTGAVLVVKERATKDASLEGTLPDSKGSKTHLVDRGMQFEQGMRVSVPVLKEILMRVSDDKGIPLELQSILSERTVTFRGNLPLNVEAGAKLALIFKLQERLSDMNRVELIAWRVERFSREEASYWLSRITHSGTKANLWAQAGLRLMLGGQPKDSGIMPMLEQLRK